ADTTRSCNRRYRCKDHRLRIRSSFLQWCGAVEVLDETRPVFKPSLATGADREVLCPLRQKKLANIKGKRADLVVRVAGKILLLERKSS
ncbi:MAG: hypothetical protein WB622_17570, partial [Acidobacteriaceae bacterium]